MALRKRMPGCGMGVMMSFATSFKPQRNGGPRGRRFLFQAAQGHPWPMSLGWPDGQQPIWRGGMGDIGGMMSAAVTATS